MPLELGVFLLIISFLGSLLGTVTGFGTSTVMIPLMLLFFPYTETLLFVGVVHWFGNLWKILFFRSGLRWDLILTFGLVSIVASVAGALLSGSFDAGLLTKLLGISFILYAVFFLVEKGLRVPTSPFFLLGGGILSGFAAGLFGIGGAVRGAFLQAYKLPKEVYLVTVGMVGIFVDSSRIVTYFFNGETLPPAMWGTLALCILISYAGGRLAAHLVKKLPQEHFRLVVIVFLLFSGVYYVVR